MRTAAPRSLLVLVLACGGSDAPYDYAGSKGAALYQGMCQVCHGEIGEGGLGPKLLDTRRSHDELVGAIEQRMPANNPGQCTGDCATEIAGFIKDGLTTSALRCDAVPPAPRRLRLLTRREYRATVRDLFGDGAPVMACARPTECAFRDRCEAGTCRPSPCDTQVFVYDPGGRTLSSVHVAGTFNNWAPTIAAGGHGLAYSPATGVWTGTFAIGAGAHQYKLVLDEREWVTDPRAPATAPDGFGGNNSAFELSCAGGAEPRDPIDGLPAENRPAGFPFDSDADSALVTASHVDAYLAAAERLADHAAARAEELHACDWSGDRARCATELVEHLGRRVFRRPLSADEHASYGELAGGDLATALHALLTSPSFLYRSEIGVPAGGRYRLTGYEIAAALSYTLVGTTPGDSLLDAAAAGELDDRAGLERHARELLADPRARDQVGELVLQWIGGEGVLTADKRADLFPGFDDATRSALADETRRFAAHVVFDGSGRFDDLVVADYTVLDATAAAFYGVPVPPGGSGKVSYDGRRAGVLGHASLLASSAHSDQTSPIRRGLVIRRNLLCQELPPPPPFAGGVPDVDPRATTRERFAMHTANPVCAGCHRYIDGVGFGLERFDAVGRWRTTEHGKPIDASGNLTDVERLGSGSEAPYATVPELAAVIANSEAARGCFTRQYLRFARGIRETLAQRCGRLWVHERFAAAGYDVRELIVQSVLSPDFVERR
jgi:mono/diheme cytochrome c family protein